MTGGTDLPVRAPRRPRFPALRAGACALGLTLAALLWLRYGTRSEVPLAEVGRDHVGSLVAVRVTSVSLGSYLSERLESPRLDAVARLGGAPAISYEIVRLHDTNRRAGLLAIVPRYARPSPGLVAGRVRLERLRYSDLWISADNAFDHVVLDTTEGRLNGHVIAAAVLAFWSLVFLALFVARWRRRLARFEFAAGEVRLMKREARAGWAPAQLPAEEAPRDA